MTTVRNASAVLLCVAVAAAPRLALACSVCTAARDDKAQTAFMLTTIFLSLLPLCMFAGFGFWAWHRYSSQKHAALAARATAAATAAVVTETTRPL